MDDDGAPLSAPDLPFIALPKPPAYWEGDDDLGFELAASEAGFLHDRLLAVASPSDSTNPSLLARLADAGPLKAGHCWAGEVIEVAAQNRPALERAGHAAALSEIGASCLCSPR